MSIINKMHSDIRDAQQDGPVLAGIPDRSRHQKTIIAIVIALLMLSAIGFATMIFNQGQESELTQAIDEPVSLEKKMTIEKESDPQYLVVEPTKVEKEVEKTLKQAAIIATTPKPSVYAAITVPEEKPIESKPVIEDQTPLEIEPTSSSSQTIQRRAPDSEALVQETQAIDYVLSDDSTTIVSPIESILEIKDAQLTNADLARIKLKEAQIAEDQGELNLAADLREQALSFDPSLHEVRKSLSLYFYGTGNINKAKQLLQTGAVISPDYFEFNLMLSRLALKEGDPQKAYLYLNQHPPEIKGNIDYYVSYAILAQKFHKYKQSEQLYSRLLSERPNSGRWLMSLAIAQDKQSKVELAVRHYQQALLQPDLSEKAKAYINQRIAYLEKSR